MAFKLMNLRYDGACTACGAPTPATTRAWWDTKRKVVTCTRCRPVDFETLTNRPAHALPPPQPVEVGVAGASAAAMHQRKAAHHRLYTDPSEEGALPSHLTSWDTGAHGEQHIGQFLDHAFAGTAVVLHDRSAVNGEKRGNIDHLIVASSGIWVVDAKNYSGLIDVRTEGFWKWKISELYVGRRNQQHLIDGMEWQSATVRRLLEPMGMGAVPIHPALCFVESEWARRSNAAAVDGVLIVSPDKLCSIASEPGWLLPDAMNAIATQLSSALPAAAKR